VQVCVPVCTCVCMCKRAEDGSNLKRQLLAVSAQAPYFWLQLPGDVHLVGVIEERFPFSFGRRVVATVLEHPQLEDWKNCVQPQEKETAITDQIRTDFQPFHFMKEIPLQSIDD